MSSQLVGYDLGPSSLAKKDGNEELKQKSMKNSDGLTKEFEFILSKQNVTKVQEIFKAAIFWNKNTVL